MTDEDYLLWMYFIEIEGMPSRSREYCFISKYNFDCFSNEYAKIITLSSIHTEFVLRTYCERNSLSLPSSDMGAIRKAVMGFRPGVASFHVSVVASDIDVRPFEDWKEDRKAEWWDAYTKIKHNFGLNINLGTQINAIRSVSACLVSMMYLFESVRVALQPFPKVLYYKRPAYLIADDYPSLP